MGQADTDALLEFEDLAGELSTRFPTLISAWRRIRVLMRILDMRATRISRLENELDDANLEIRKLKKIIDTPDPRDFLEASTRECQYQNYLWGDQDGTPSSFGEHDDPAFLGLLDHLGIKVINTPDDDLEKKLHRITTIAAAAANWHRTVIERVKRSTLMLESSS